MLKTYQFKTQCKGDIQSSKTADTSKVVFKLCDTSCFNQHPWMHFNLNTSLYT